MSRFRRALTVLSLLATGCSCAQPPVATLDAASLDGSSFDATADVGTDALVSDDAGHDARAIDVGPAVLPYDTCDAPLDVSAGGTFSVDLAGYHEDYPVALAHLACGGLGPTDPCLDIVLYFHLDTPRDIEIAPRTIEGARTAVSLRTGCGTDAPLVEEVGGFSSPLRRRALPAGTYFVFAGAGRGNRAGSASPTHLDVRVTFGDPTPIPTNVSCDAPTDLGAGGHVEASFVDVPGGEPGRSGTLAYAITTHARSNLRVGVRLGGADEPIAGVSVTVGSPCGSGIVLYDDRRSAGYVEPVERTLYDLAPDTYYVVLEVDGVDLEPDFALDVTTLPSSAPPPGDTCASPIAIAPNVPYVGSLAEMQNDFPGNEIVGAPPRDTVHVITIDERSDVWIRLGRDTAPMAVALLTTCDAASTPLASDDHGRGPAALFVPDLPAGTYYVVAAGLAPDPYDLSVEAWPSSSFTRIAVADNDSCATAFDVPSTGGVFVGDTTSAHDDTQSGCVASLPAALTVGAHDVVFRWTTTHTQRVIVSTAGTSFSATLSLRNPLCHELSCAGLDTDSFETLDVVLDAGTYLFVVDGFFPRNLGPYRFEVRPF